MTRSDVAFDDEVKGRSDPAWASIEPVEALRRRVEWHAMEMNVDLRSITDNALAGWARHVGGVLTRAQLASRVARGARHNLQEHVIVDLGRAWAVLIGIRVVAVWPRGRGCRELKAFEQTTGNPPPSPPCTGVLGAPTAGRADTPKCKNRENSRVSGVLPDPTGKEASGNGA